MARSCRGVRHEADAPAREAFRSSPGRRFCASAAILAGGFGTRLRPVVADRPKVLAPVHGRPFLTFLLDQLAAASVEEVVILSGYQADQVRRTLGQSYAGLHLVYSEEPFPLGTGGAVRWALPKLASPTILLLNGDSYGEVDWAAFHQLHERTAAEASLVLARVPGATRFGNVLADSDGRVLRFAEKAQPTDWVNAGIYLLERSLLEHIPVGRPLSLERELLPSWVARGRVFGCPCSGRFLDIGTPAAYAEAERFFSAPRAHQRPSLLLHQAA